MENRIEQRLTEHRAVFEPRDLRRTALEQAAGELSPEQALEVARGMVRDRRILTLEGGRMTTLAVRAQEQAIERRTITLAQPANRDVGETIRINASRQVAERIGAPLSREQEAALLLLTGPERAAVLIGPAGTGKGVVIDAAARAEQLAGRETIVSGSTAERLGADSPALEGNTLTLDALTARAQRDNLHIGPDTTIVLDEAGMVDHHRLDKLTALVEQSGAKLIAVGDGHQLPAIGPSGMFDRLSEHAPTMELATIHRTKDPAEQRAWQALRAGEPERAMAHYKRQGRLHLSDTRDQAAEHAVQDWARLTLAHDPREVALIADASNKEIDRLNARAQHLRAIRGELGTRHVPLDSARYDLREGDHVAFIAQHHPHGHARVENGSRGEITKISQDNNLTVTLDGSGRTIRLAGEQVENLRLAYAQHGLPTARRNRRALHRPHRRLANQQGDRLRPSHPRSPRHRLVHQPRPARRRRTRCRPHYPTHTGYDQQPTTNPATHPLKSRGVEDQAIPASARAPQRPHRQDGYSTRAP